MKIGFIGLGRMGSAMAENLIRAGHELVVYNRSRAKADALAELGARVAGSVAEACQGEVVWTMLADDDALKHVAQAENGLLDTLAPSALHISSSTIGIALCERLTEAHGARRQRFVAAPVFGRPEAAKAAALYIIAAGAKKAIEAATPLFDAVGKNTFVVAEAPKTANLVKLSGNFLLAAVIESLGEAMALVSKGGVDKRQYLEILTSTLFDAPAYKTYGAIIADGNFEPAGLAAPLGLKDVRLALAAAEDLRTPMPLASLLRDRFLTLLANGGEALDWSAIGSLAAWDAGAGPPCFKKGVASRPPPSAFGAAKA
jgi:3-hydroxyisobutyrate dehydrogenase-like beta-hydroxyacid dehydrogenase